MQVSHRAAITNPAAESPHKWVCFMLTDSTCTEDILSRQNTVNNRVMKQRQLIWSGHMRLLTELVWNPERKAGLMNGWLVVGERFVQHSSSGKSRIHRPVMSSIFFFMDNMKGYYNFQSISDEQSTGKTTIWLTQTVHQTPFPWMNMRALTKLGWAQPYHK